MTFHGAGPADLNAEFLDLSRTLKVPVTIFAVGDWVRENDSLVRLFASAGNELANHTASHPALRDLDRAAVAAEISGCAQALRSVTGSIGVWFRPSGTPSPTALISEESAKAGYPTILGYDVDSRDYEDPGADVVVSRTLDAMLPGSIVSLHLGHRGTLDALTDIVIETRRRGLEPVTASTLLSTPSRRVRPR